MKLKVILGICILIIGLVIEVISIIFSLWWLVTAITVLLIISEAILIYLYWKEEQGEKLKKEIEIVNASAWIDSKWKLTLQSVIILINKSKIDFYPVECSLMVASNKGRIGRTRWKQGDNGSSPYPLVPRGAIDPLLGKQKNQKSPRAGLPINIENFNYLTAIEELHFGGYIIFKSEYGFTKVNIDIFWQIDEKFKRVVNDIIENEN